MYAVQNCDNVFFCNWYQINVLFYNWRNRFSGTHLGMTFCGLMAIRLAGKCERSWIYGIVLISS